MGLNFPLYPALGEMWPSPAEPGVPQWTWTGTEWTSGSYDTSSYVKKTGDSMSGGLLPEVTGTLDLGSAAKRWGTVYTSDLDLSNEVGDWTIVEGEDDLFLYNNKKGRVYRFALYEVDPSQAPPKRDR